MLHCSSDTVSHPLRRGLSIQGIVILHQYATRFYLDIDLKLRHVQFQQFLTYGLASYGIFRQHPHLVGVGDGRMESIVGGNACVGIVLVAQRLVEGVADLMEVFTHRHIVNLQAKSQCVDKHAHRVGNLQVRAAAADGADIYLAVVGVARDHITGGGEIQMGRRDVVLSAENGGFVEVGGTECLANKSLLVGLGQVGRNLARSF